MKGRIVIGGVMMVALLLTGSAVATEYHVSVSGSDENTGTPDNPFKTIQKAADVLQAGDVCFISPGRYRETVTAKTAGSPGSPIRFEALKPGTVVVDGTEVVSVPWQKHNNGIYKTPLEVDTEQLFYGERAMVWARWPNMKFSENWQDHKKWARTDEGSQPGMVICSELKELNFDLKSATCYLKYAKGNNTWSREIISMNDDGFGFKWNDTDFYTNDRTAEDGPRGYGDGLKKGMERSKRLGLPHPLADNEFFIRGRLELLDAEEEWFYDKPSGTLYFHAPGGREPGKGRVWYKKRDYGFYGEETAYLELKGITFFGCSLNIEGRNITLDKCTFLYPDENLYFPDRIAMKENEQYQFKPVTIAGYNNKVVNSLFRYGTGDTLKMKGYGNLVENCVVTEGNRHGRHDNKAIWFQHLEGKQETEEERTNTVRRCTIYNTGGIGIYMLAISPASGGGRVEYNHVFNTGWYCTDISVFYAPLRFTHGFVNHNWFHNVASMAYRVDIRGTDVTYHHNVTWNAEVGADAEGESYRIYNNTSLGGRMGISKHNVLWREEEEQDHGFPIVTDWPIMNNVAESYNDVVSLRELEFLRRSISENKLHPDRTRSWTQPLKLDVGNVRHNVKIDDARELFVSVDGENLDLRPRKGSPLIDAGAVVEGVTDGYKGEAPDIGAYEYGGEYWAPGADWLPDGMAVPKTTAEANNLAKRLRKDVSLK